MDDLRDLFLFGDLFRVDGFADQEGGEAMKEIGTLYRVSGEVLEVHPINERKFTLEELQTYVGGHIELVPGTAKAGHPAAWCNEEGKLLKLRFNPEATRVFMVGIWTADVLVGDVIQVRKEK